MGLVVGETKTDRLLVIFDRKCFRNVNKILDLLSRPTTFYVSQFNSHPVPNRSEMNVSARCNQAYRCND